MSATKVAVVTGSNKGIGFATVRGLCKAFDGDVILTARNEELGLKAVADLERDGLRPKFHQLDISSLASIRALEDFLQSQYQGLDVLVNNAGIAFTQDSTVPFGEQAETTVRVNFFATQNMCQELFHLLRPHARVVNVSSCFGMLGRIPGESLRKELSSPTLTEEQLGQLMRDFVTAAKLGQHVAQGWPDSAYAVSKVGLTALTMVQQRDFDKDPLRPDLAVNAVHPGIVDTDMTRHAGPMSAEEGAKSSVFAALLPPGASSPRGQFIWHDTSLVPWDGPLLPPV